MSKIWTDNPYGLDTDLTAINTPDIGTANNPLGTVYAETVVADNITGDTTLAYADYLEATDAAGTGTDKLIRNGASGQTIVNTKTGTTGGLYVNDASVGGWSATAITYPKFNLTDGSDKNYMVNIVGAGTAYALTNTAAAVDLGTTDPVITIDKAGTYKITATINLQMAGATFAASRVVTIKLRRTNNTPADLTGGSAVMDTGITTTVTGTMEYVTLQVIYTTANLDDAITIFGDVSVVPSAGALNVTQANIIAERLYA